MGYWSKATFRSPLSTPNAGCQVAWYLWIRGRYGIGQFRGMLFWGGRSPSGSRVYSWAPMIRRSNVVSTLRHCSSPDDESVVVGILTSLFKGIGCT